MKTAFLQENVRYAESIPRQGNPRKAKGIPRASSSYFKLCGSSIKQVQSSRISRKSLFFDSSRPSKSQHTSPYSYPKPTFNTDSYHRYRIDPTLGEEQDPVGAARLACLEAAEYKKMKMTILWDLWKDSPNLVPLEDVNQGLFPRQRPVWCENVHGQYAVQITVLDKSGVKCGHILPEINRELTCCCSGLAECLTGRISFKTTRRFLDAL
jgi:hypothetical protein